MLKDAFRAVKKFNFLARRNIPRVPTMPGSMFQAELVERMIMSGRPGFGIRIFGERKNLKANPLARKPVSSFFNGDSRIF